VLAPAVGAGPAAPALPSVALVAKKWWKPTAEMERYIKIYLEE